MNTLDLRLVRAVALVAAQVMLPALPSATPPVIVATAMQEDALRVSFLFQSDDTYILQATADVTPVAVWNKPEMTLAPGDGVQFDNAGDPFLPTFVGEVRQGTLRRLLPAGLILLGSVAPIPGLYQFPAEEGDGLQTWDQASRALITHTYQGAVGCDVTPAIQPGEAFWVRTSRAKEWVQDFVVNGPASLETPFVYQQPTHRNPSRGASTTFTVAATGTAPLAYQWRRNGENLLDGTNSSYVIAAVQPDHQGQYAVVVSNPYGSVTSEAAMLTVQGGPGPSAAWEGSDDFSAGIAASNWTFRPNNSGDVKVVGLNGRASFIAPAVIRDDDKSVFIIWRGNPTATEDWTADVTGHVSATATRLQLWALRTDVALTSDREAYVVEMYRRADRGFMVTQYRPDGGTRRALVDATNTSFALRLAYRSAAERIEAWCDPDATGRGWKLLDAISLAEFSPTMTASHTFTFALNVIVNKGAGPIPEGEIWADDFRLSAPGSASSPAPLGVAREWHTATLLTDGRVLVAGGYTGDFPNGTYPAAAELYDPASGKWTATGALANPRGRHTATRLPDGKVVVVGGAGAAGVLNTMEQYDPMTGTWTTLASLGTRRAVHAATLLPNGQIVVMGGTSDGTGALATAEVYDPATGRWTPAKPMHTARCYPGAVLLCDGRVLVAGGAADARGNGSLASCEVYDPATGTWTATGPMAIDRQVHSVTVLADGRVLAAGGEDSQEVRLASAELYDPARGAWTSTSALKWARKWHTANLLPSGQVLVAGGAGSSGYPAEVELYDPATGKWTGGGSLTTPRYWHTGTLLADGKVLIVGGGVSDDPAFASVERYDAPPGVARAVVIQDVEVSAEGAVHFGFRNPPGLNFRVLSTADLGGPAVNWTPRGMPMEFCPGWYEFTDSQPAKDGRRFYRVENPWP